MSLPTPNYILSEDIVILEEKHRSGSWGYGPPPDKIYELFKGTFVRPLDPYYVPKHVIDDPLFGGMVPPKYTYCYTPQGIVPIPSDKFHRV